MRLNFKYIRYFFPLYLFGLASLDAQIVAVSANAQYVVNDLIQQFAKETGAHITSVIGSSGTLTAQIKNGAPFDLFLSADTAYPGVLWRDGYAVDSPRVYGFGTLVMWTSNGRDLSLGMESLRGAKVKTIAIANPQNAPYGAAAVEALEKSLLWETVKSKIVYGESISQVNQYVDIRAVDVGFTSASVVLSEQLKGKGTWKEVERSLYSPIPQAAILLNSELMDSVGSGLVDKKKIAKQFYDFLFSVKAKEIFQRFGYSVP